MSDKNYDEDAPTEEALEDLFRPDVEEDAADKAKDLVDKAVKEVKKGKAKEATVPKGRNRVRGPNGRIILE